MMVEHNQSTYYKDPYPTTNTGTYDNKWKFNGKELDDATGMYYYGARYYDPRISIFVSVDPLAEKYLNMTPYNYVANNPVNAIDPDGRDFRMIMQRDSKGNITHITLQATVYLQGKGASQEMANKMNKAFGDKFSGYKTVNGVKVGLDVVYAYDKGNSRNESNLRAGENIFNVRTDMGENERSFVKSRGAVGNTYFTGNTGEINNKSNNLQRIIIHETLHLFGLSDRYDDYEGNNLKIGQITVPHSGFENDIMGGGSDFSEIHYENIINFGSSIQGTRGENGFESYNSNRMYDRASKTGLKNGNKQNTHYDENSN